MQTKEYSSLGLKWPLTVPSTVAECVAASGSEEAVVKTFNEHIVYHVTLGGVRSDFVDLVAKATGIPVKTKVTGKDKEGNDVVETDETDLEYVERVCAVQNTTAEALAALTITSADAAVGTTTIQAEVIRLNPYNAKATERKPKAPRAPTKGDLAMADAVIKAGQDKVDAVVALLSTTLNRSVSSDRVELARAIMDDRLAEQERVKAAQSAKFGVVSATPASAAA